MDGKSQSSGENRPVLQIPGRIQNPGDLFFTERTVGNRTGRLPLDLFIKPALFQYSYIKEAKRSPVYVNRRPTELALVPPDTANRRVPVPHSSDPGSCHSDERTVSRPRCNFESFLQRGCGAAAPPSFPVISWSWICLVAPHAGAWIETRSPFGHSCIMPNHGAAAPSCLYRAKRFVQVRFYPIWMKCCFTSLS